MRKHLAHATLPLALGLLLLAAYHLTYGRYFPNAAGFLGHDYSLTLPDLLDGYFWFRQNGLVEIPWFTPSFCGGQAFFADPQRTYYNLGQFLSFFVGPLQGIYLTLLTLAAAGFFCMYWLAGRTLGLSRPAALCAATLFMFNGFFSHRMIIGHYGFHGFMLIPLLGILLLGRKPLPCRLEIPAAALLLGYWVQSGYGTLIVPSGLSLLALAAVAFRNSPQGFGQFMLRGTLAACLALLICSNKLYANVQLMSHFPRSEYLLPGFAAAGDVLEVSFQALFYSSEHTFRTASPLIHNVQWAIMPHEWAYGLTLVPLALLLGGLAAPFLHRNAAGAASRPRVLDLLTLALLLLPLALQYYSPAWNALLKSLPIIKTTASPFRWLLLYLPLLCLAAAWAVDRLGEPWRRLALVLTVLLVPLLNHLERETYYSEQNYDPAPIEQAYQAVVSGAQQPAIHGLLLDLPRIWPRNDYLTQGISPLLCYNPLFGYRLENYPAGPFRNGPIDPGDNGEFLNLRNPACLLYPEENQCAPGNAFRRSERDAALAFASYHPYAFEQPAGQQVANGVSQTVLCLVLVWLLSAVALALRTRMFRRVSRDT
ncbi:MAG: hypothetical protein RIR00_1484 [Pseudomonadota bacterium]|jgi:hypothetical protein